jgi:hypothetical protein
MGQNGVRFFNQGAAMRPVEWLAKSGRLTTLRDVLYFIFNVNSQAPYFFIYAMTAARKAARETKTAIAAPPTRDVLDRRAAYPGDCTVWESADRETEISKALDPSDIQRPSADK